MGGYHTCNQECKNFARKSLTHCGGQLETAESARSSTWAKRAMQACLEKERHQNHPPPLSPQKFVCHRSITLNSTSRKWRRLSPHSEQPRPSPHRPTWTSARAEIVPWLFSLISIVRRTLSRISTAWPSHPHFPSRRDFHLEKNSRSIWAHGGPYERPVLFRYQNRTPWPMCPPRRHLWQTYGHRHEVPQTQLRSWCEHVWSTALALSHWKNIQSAQPKQKGKGRRDC